MESKPVIFGFQGYELLKSEQDFFKQHQPLGFIIFGRNVNDPEQLKALITSLKSCVHHQHVPILIDQEGGRVQRLKKTYWPTWPAVGDFINEGSLENAIQRSFDQGKTIGAHLRELGINVNCSPCCDLRSPFGHAVIGDRSFSSEVNEVITLALAMMQGLWSEKIMPVMKHLPGHGRVLTDSHETLPIVDVEEDILRKTDFFVFEQIISTWKKTPFPMVWAMTAHVLYPYLDQNYCATLSHNIIQNIIRERMGFDGLLLSDCLTMKALSGSMEERGTRALAAGCDVILHSNGNLPEMKSLIDNLPNTTKKILDLLDIL